MKFQSAIITALSAVGVSNAFTFIPSGKQFASTRLNLGNEGNVVFGGNTWKPDSEKMGSTDTGDFFPEGYDPNEVEFSAGMMGSQQSGRGNDGPQLPGE